MADLVGKQWRMQTNIKAAPNSQGTLFQGGHPRAGAGQPWPRGYSPERRDAVVDAMDSGDKTSGVTVRSYLGGNKGKPSAQVAAARDFKTYPEEERTGREGTSKAVANLARSTVPTDHIRGASYYFQIQDNQISKNTAGHYKSGSGAWSPSITVRASHADGTTTIHEVGHHVSNLLGTPHSKTLRDHDDLEASGQEESFAESYAETHYRDHRGRPLTNFSTSPEKWHGHYGMPGPEKPYTFSDDDPRRAFHRGFYGHQAEHSPSSLAHKASLAKIDQQDLHPTGMRGQIPMLAQDTTEWHEDGNTPKRREWRSLYHEEHEQGFG
jgi:hypothetical protein